MKVAEISALSSGDSPSPQEPVRRAISAENREATVSPTAMDTAPFDKDRLKEALKAAEKLSDYSNRRLKFEYQEEADVFQVSVVDDDGAGEVIRKIPPDSILRMIESVRKYVGTSLDTKA